MNSTNLLRPGNQHVHTRVSLRKPLRCGFTILLCSCLLFGASHCRAQETQDAAEAARQERARNERPQKQNHVYTEEDLGRSKILTPEDEARFATQRHLAPPASEPPQPSLDAGVNVPQLPLGDIARRYRNARLALQAPASFHLPFDEPSFAAPIISISNVAPPHLSFSPGHANLAPARASSATAPAITSPAPLRRVDPFTRRSALVALPRLSQLAAEPSPAPAGMIAPAPSPHPKVDTSIGSRIGLRSPLVSSSFSPVQTRTVQPGDTLWKLAQQSLGRGSRWHELLAANPRILDPAHLAAGTKIVVPSEGSTLKSPKSDRTSERKIAVEKGDTLTKIAQSQYRRATAWHCIVQANPEIVDPDRVSVGQQLILPFNCKQ